MKHCFANVFSEKHKKKNGSIKVVLIFTCSVFFLLSMQVLFMRTIFLLSGYCEHLPATVMFTSQTYHLSFGFQCFKQTDAGDRFTLWCFYEEKCAAVLISIETGKTTMSRTYRKSHKNKFLVNL